MPKNNRVAVKTENIRIRSSQKDKDLLLKRAEQEQMSMSDYLIYLVRKDAEAHGVTID